MKSIDIKTPKDLLKKWLIRAHINIQTHYRAANRFTGYNYWIGIPLICATIILGSDLIRTLFGDTEQEKIYRSLIGIAASLLAGFQTLFKFEERRNRHMLAAQKYGEIVRRIETLISCQREIEEVDISDIEARINTAVKESPVPPSQIFDEENQRAREVYYGSEKKISS